MADVAHQKLRILLVEDDLHVSACFESLLEFDGHEVRAVDNGHAALALLDHEKFDLVITDYWMPQMKGDELATLIKQRWPNLPIILASGSLSNVSTFYGSSPGVDCLLNKPFSLTELREAIVWVLALYADSRLLGPEITGMLDPNPNPLNPPKLPPADHLNGIGE